MEEVALSLGYAVTLEKLPVEQTVEQTDEEQDHDEMIKDT
jgi:hypothetical protein